MPTSLPAWLTDPALAGLWERAADRVERNGLVAVGRVRVPLTTRAGRHAAGDLLGRSITRDSVMVDLAELDSRVHDRSGHGGLLDVLPALCGRPLRDRVAEREAHVGRREAPLELARELVDQPWTALWVDDLRRTGLLTRSPSAERTVREAAAVLGHLFETSRGADETRSRVDLAAQVVGDAHALDEDRLLHRLVLRALAAASGVAVPASAAGRWALWESVGVSPDSVSSTCLTLGLLGDQPRHLTRWHLDRMPDFVRPEGPVLVCENPRVLEAVAETYTGRVPAVCTSGEPNTVVTSVLARLVASGATLRYHGDFDWPGLAIANRVLNRFGATPWLMCAADYETHVRPDAPELAGTPVEPLWDPELGATMRTHGLALHEETVLGVLLRELDPPG